MKYLLVLSLKYKTIDYLCTTQLEKNMNNLTEKEKKQLRDSRNFAVSGLVSLAIGLILMLLTEFLITQLNPYIYGGFLGVSAIYFVLAYVEYFTID